MLYVHYVFYPQTTLLGRKCKACEETEVLREEPCCPQRTHGSSSYSRLLLIELLYGTCAFGVLGAGTQGTGHGRTMVR